MKEELKSVREIIAALGGIKRVSELVGYRENTVSQWQTLGWIPSDNYEIISKALGSVGKTAGGRLFHMRVRGGGASRAGG